MFVLNFVISGKVTSLHNVIKYVKRSKSSFHEFQCKSYAKCNFKGKIKQIFTRVDISKKDVRNIKLSVKINKKVNIPGIHGMQTLTTYPFTTETSHKEGQLMT